MNVRSAEYRMAVAIGVSCAAFFLDLMGFQAKIRVNTGNLVSEVSVSRMILAQISMG